MSAAGSSLAKGITSAVTKQLQSKAGVRLGSRDERRLVYRRFQDAVTETYTLFTVAALEQRLFLLSFGKRYIGFTLRPRAAEQAARAVLPALAQSNAELMKAYLDLRLVANPDPVAAADVVLNRLTDVLDLNMGVPQDELTEAVSRVVEAQRKFLDVCRDDLWYLPQRWQVYRPDWWKARRWRRNKASVS
ncbi:hypothetical protein [Streptomyces sp. NPDC059272]|uniref:hypothetical protein n=1 Tax=Streptomyces sp. NPDC059272 TaxID=3346800 RepID=UPI0036D1C13B